jgi:hypothetical protein
MICHAYRSNVNKIELSEEFESGYEYEYIYQTESYDFRPYQSHDTETGRSDARGFTYNKSIKSEEDDDTNSQFNSESVGSEFEFPKEQPEKKYKVLRSKVRKGDYRHGSTQIDNLSHHKKIMMKLSSQRNISPAHM